MKEVLDAFWRAAVGCLHPRVILWSLLPLLLSGGVVVAFGWFFWAHAVDAVRQAMAQWPLVVWVTQGLDRLGAGALVESIAPLFVVAAAAPMIVILTLLLVAWLMTPVLVDMIASRRFPTLERRAAAGTWWLGLFWTLAATFAALLLLGLSLPLWWVPPLPLLVPPLVWGWLTAKVLAFDTLAAHASAAERRQILRSSALPLLGMGVVCGLLGSAPTVLWALGALSVLLAPVVIVTSIWLYTLVFAFASLWFGHYTLARLAALRAVLPMAVPTDHGSGDSSPVDAKPATDGPAAAPLLVGGPPEVVGTPATSSSATRPRPPLS
jgi:hypothetical protein